MATADEQIRVSERVKAALDSFRREGESYNDVLERLLADRGDAEFEDGFGVLDEDDARAIRERRERAKAKRRSRLEEGLTDR